MMKLFAFVAIIAVSVLSACGPISQSSDEKQSKQQEQTLQEATSAVGMPNIVNFQRRRLMKDIYEMLDQTSLVTYSYTMSEMTGRLVYFCNSIGYPLPFATQFTNPEKVDFSSSYGYLVLPQAEPDGNFSPSSAEASWVMCVDPATKRARPVYSESRITTSQFPLTADTPTGTAAAVAITLPAPAAPN